MKTIKPLKTRILVKMIENNSESEGGIYIPEDSREQSKEAEIIDIGSEVSALAIGDKVLLSMHGAGVEVKLEGESFYILEEESVLGILGNLAE